MGQLLRVNMKQRAEFHDRMCKVLKIGHHGGVEVEFMDGGKGIHTFAVQNLEHVDGAPQLCVLRGDLKVCAEQRKSHFELIFYANDTAIVTLESLQASGRELRISEVRRCA